MKTAPRTAIVIPARYGSTRFPGKPLAEIGGRSMLSRVVDVARQAADGSQADVHVIVTTDDERIAAHAAEIGVTCITTPEDCPTGSDRVLAAVKQLDEAPDFIINLQGDAPFTPPEAITGLIESAQSADQPDVITPVHRLSWENLDRLREAKKTTPFSGTTVIINPDGRALWFSKNILPAIRKEDALRQTEALSPVYRHMGLYGFTRPALEKFCALPQSPYELLEGLEQLRMLEAGMHVQTVPVDIEAGALQSGIDTPEDLKRAEASLAS